MRRSSDFDGVLGVGEAQGDLQRQADAAYPIKRLRIMGHMPLKDDKRASSRPHLIPATCEDARVLVGPDPVAATGRVIKAKRSVLEPLRPALSKANLRIIGHDEISLRVGMGKDAHAILRVRALLNKGLRYCGEALRHLSPISTLEILSHSPPREAKPGVNGRLATTLKEQIMTDVTKGTLRSSKIARISIVDNAMACAILYGNLCELPINVRCQEIMLHQHKARIKSCEH
jgi:hypothetical protein